MPYIEDERRELLARHVAIPRNQGELAFQLALSTDDYFIDKEITFTSMSEALAALESVKFELQRRFLAPYEDGKREENGDVFFNLCRPDGSIPDKVTEEILRFDHPADMIEHMTRQAGIKWG